jgi:Spy/CpxP family protein refolding chaperone
LLWKAEKPVAEVCNGVKGQGEDVRARHIVIIPALLAILAGLSAVRPTPALAQNEMKSAVERFAFDLHQGVKNGNLTPQQKQQVRSDLKALHQAQENHDRRAAFRAMRNFHQLLDSGAFQPQDAERIKQDMQAIRAAKKQQGGGMGGM